MIRCILFAIRSSASCTYSLIFTGSCATGMIVLVEFSSASASMEVLGFVGFPSSIYVNMVSGRINYSTRCNLSVAIQAPCIASISRSITFCSYCIANLSMLMIIIIQRAVSNVTYGADRLCVTSSFATSMLTLINDITACYNSTLFPVICVISGPYRCRIVRIHFYR